MPPNTELIERLRARYSADPIPACSVCGARLSIASAGGGRATEYACPRAPLDIKDDHYERSKFIHYRPGDSDVLSLLDRITSLEEGLGEAFDFLGGVDDAADIRDRLLGLLSKEPRE